MAKLQFNDILGFMIEALSECTMKLILRSEHEIDSQQLEQVDVGIASFFHSKCVEKLLRDDSISEDIANRCLQIHKAWMELTSRPHSAGEIRTSHEWRKLFEDVDEVLPLLLTCNHRVIPPPDAQSDRTNLGS